MSEQSEEAAEHESGVVLQEGAAGQH